MTQTPSTPAWPQLSRIAFGCWRQMEWCLAPQQLLRLIEQALELEVSTFEHADIYGDYQCEQAFGDALALQPALRQRLQLVSKCGIKLVSAQRPQHRIHSYDTSYAHIVQSVEQSLRNFRSDYLDLLLIHRPDHLLHADEVARAFSDLRQQGKVRHFGVSNFLPHQFQLLQSRLDFPLVANQIQISLLDTSGFYDGSLSLCQQLSTIPMAWSPLGGGRLFDPADPQASRLRPVLQRLAARLEASPEQIALAWLLKHPAGIVPISGSGKIERLRQAVAALRIELSHDDWFELLQAGEGRKIP
jgi:predicted oxidoreductase